MPLQCIELLRSSDPLVRESKVRVNNSNEKSKIDFFSLLKSIIGRAVIKIGS